MQAMISADSSMKQAKVQGSMAAQMEGRAGVKEAEIRQDSGNGNAEKKKEQLADLQAKAQSATAAQMSNLSNANKVIEEAGKSDNGAETIETKKNHTQKAEKTRNKADMKEETIQNADVTTKATTGEPDSESDRMGTGQAVYTPIDLYM